MDDKRPLDIALSEYSRALDRLAESGPVGKALAAGFPDVTPEKATNTTQSQRPRTARKVSVSRRPLGLRPTDTRPTDDEMPDGVYQRGGRLWISYYAPTGDGRMRQVREPAKRPDGKPAQTVKEAVKYRQARLVAVTNHRTGVQAFQGPRAERMLFTELLDRYEQHAKVRPLKSLPQIRSRVKRLRAHFAGYRALAVTHDVLMRYIQTRQADGAANATINRETEIIGRAFALAVVAGKLAFAPKVPSLSEHNARRGFFERADFEAVMKHIADDDVRDFIEYLYRTAWRKGEAATLEWSDVDLAGDGIRLRAEHSKNGRARFLAMDAELKALIARRCERRTTTGRDGTVTLAPLVFHREGKPIGDVRKTWATACIKAGLFHVVTDANGKERKVPARLIHDLRRTGVRDMVRAGVPETVAMAVSGHRTRAVFDRYNITSEDDVRQAVARTSDYRATLPATSNVIPLRAEGRQ
jgi:integrase